MATIGAWVAVTVAAIAAIVALLGGSLTTEGEPTNNPAVGARCRRPARAFAADPETAVTDIVVVRSERYTVDAPSSSASCAA